MEWPPHLGADLTRLLCAAIFSALLGGEREWRRKPAGVRTHMLVGLGSAGFVLVAVRAAEAAMRLGDQGLGAHELVAMDPIRVVEGVVGGIGFLGAGTILHGRGSVEGLTTAASIWLTGAIGVGCGMGELVLAAQVTAFALLVLLGLGLLTRRTNDAGQESDR